MKAIKFRYLHLVEKISLRLSDSNYNPVFNPDFREFYKQKELDPIVEILYKKCGRP